ncbi:MAG: hypothetical protein FE041_01805 [Thermoplasmata archaeon]|nr:MAG: hypothetical protein FE041_01805 [Thermoplasmata archaeon]
MKNFIPLVKVHVNNRLTHSVATHQIPETYPIEAMKKLGVKEKTSERMAVRVLERIGNFFLYCLKGFNNS